MNEWGTAETSSRFTNNTICTWRIKADQRVFNVDKGGYYLNININRYTYAHVYIANGTAFNDTKGNYTYL